MMLIPFIGMLWAPTETTTENRELASAPKLFTQDGGFNVNVLDDAGAYFEDHFAYRNTLVSANAFLRASLGSSASDSVVVGKEGWLYYTGTLPDYLGQSTLSDRALRNIAHNMALMQGFAKAHDAQFVFTVAPNKNSLYPCYMPEYYIQTTQAGNWERLKPYLDIYGVNYVDLFEVLGSNTETLYYRQDTHWNNKGALLGGNSLLASFGVEPLSIEDNTWAERNDYVGDVARMLYPSNPTPELAYYAQGYNDGPSQNGSLWEWVQGESVEDDLSCTKSAGEGHLVVFRDSFANALIPYFSATFAESTFTKLVPYDAATISVQEANYVVVERAERHLDYLATNAPIMPAPIVKLDVDLADAGMQSLGTTLQVIQDGGYTVISGELDESLWDENVDIYIEAPSDDGQIRFYEASTLSSIDSPYKTSDTQLLDEPEESISAIQGQDKLESDWGYVAYLVGDRDFSGKTLKAIAMKDGKLLGYASFTI